jgi:hypothetical protein
MLAIEDTVVSEDNRAEVMMEAGLGFIRSGDREAALSFFQDAVHLFREAHDDRSAAIAQAWLDVAANRAMRAAR